MPIDLTMTPLDWGLTGAALLTLIYAARTLVSGQGRSQMGMGFAIVASVVWTAALSRHLEGFSTTDGLRVAFGVLMLVPVLRVVFSHTGGSITGAVMSIILASVVAGPVISRYSRYVASETAPQIRAIEDAVEGLDTKIAELEATLDTVAGFAASEREKLDDLGHSTAAEVEADPKAMLSLKKYAAFRGEMDAMTQQISELKAKREDLQNSLVAIENGAAGLPTAQSEAEQIRARIEAEVERDQTMLERYSEQGAMLDLFEREFGPKGE